jgi:hypothetical protein
LTYKFYLQSRIIGFLKMMSPNSTKFINFLIFQFGWIMIVFYHNFLSGLLGLGLALLNYLFIRISLKELMLSFAIAFLGILNDLIIAKIGFLDFSNAIMLPIPLWLASLWLLFVSTFASSLAWLRCLNVFFLAFLGAFGGAISYCAAEKLNALSYHTAGLPSFIFYGLNWLLLFPFLFILYHYIRKRIFTK